MKRRAFTLIELLLVMAIMAMLGVASTAGYSALQRGMSERAAVAGASGLLRSAKERADVDRVPTAVFCYNKLLREADENAGENAEVVGVMVAIRQAGRLSWVNGKFLYDEFGDLEHSGNYEVLSDDANLTSSADGTQSPSDLENYRGGLRLWSMPTSDGEMKYSVVSSAVWAEMRDLELFSGPVESRPVGAFYDLGVSKHAPTWKVGSPYGFEIGEVQLPKGFIFGDKIPSSMGDVQLVKSFVFKPSAGQSSVAKVKVNSTKAGSNGMPQKFKAAGEATSDVKAKL